MPTFYPDDWQEPRPPDWRDWEGFTILAVLIPLAALVITLRACCGG